VEWKDEGTYTCSAREINSAAEAAKPTKQEIMLEIYGKILFYQQNYFFRILLFSIIVEKCCIHAQGREGTS
jgi:hypothetical protein